MLSERSYGRFQERSLLVFSKCSCGMFSQYCFWIFLKRSTGTFREHCLGTLKKPGHFFSSRSVPMGPSERSRKVLCYGGVETPCIWRCSHQKIAITRSKIINTIRIITYIISFNLKVYSDLIISWSIWTWSEQSFIIFF